MNRRKTVLIVEDEEFVRLLLARLFSDDYHLIVESDGQKAYEYVSAHSLEIDLLFADVVLPGRSGIAIAERLFSQNPRAKVVLTSGYAEPENIPPEFNFIKKPFSPEVVMGLVRGLLLN